MAGTSSSGAGPSGYVNPPQPPLHVSYMSHISNKDDQMQNVGSYLDSPKEVFFIMFQIVLTLV